MPIESDTVLRRYGINVTGRVQGVGYRFFVRELAVARGFAGWVCNESNGCVHLEIQCDSRSVAEFCEILKEGPMLSQVKDLEITEIPVIFQEKQFIIRY